MLQLILIKDRTYLNGPLELIFRQTEKGIFCTQKPVFTFCYIRDTGDEIYKDFFLRYHF